MKQNLNNGCWFKITNESEHKMLKKFGNLDNRYNIGARVQIGTFVGPGKYLVLQYQQRCPRNCCYDSVVEVLTSQEVIDQVKSEIIDLANLLREARTI